MSESIEVKGKSIDDAIEIALKELHTTKDNIEYEVIEESNKTLFSILSPKYAVIRAKVLDEKKCEDIKTEEKIERIVEALTQEDCEIVKNEAQKFLKDFFESLGYTYSLDIDLKDNILSVNINSEKSAILIGYRGEVLDSLQTILSLTVNNKIPKGIKVQLNTENYREKRKKTLEELAYRMASNVVRNKKTITLEPMYAYERKIIHSSLQNDKRVETKSVGDEPYRKVVISLKSNY